MKPYKKSDSRDSSEIRLQLWEEFKNNFLTEFMNAERIHSIDGLSDEAQKYFRSKANTAFEKFVRQKLNKFVEDCKSEGEIWLKDKYPYNKGWIINDGKIQETLKRYPKLLDVLNFIDNEGHHDETIEEEELRAYTAKLGKGMTEERLYSHVIVNQEFYEKAERELGLKKPTMQKYLQAFSETGIIRKIKHLQTHGRAMLYIAGYFHTIPTSGRKKKVRFLMESKHKKILQDFTY
jgi:predicted transcriptional regulator